LLVTANYNSFKAVNPWATGTGTPGAAAIFGSNAMATTGTNVQDNQFYGAAAYDFGILKAYAQYINRKATSEIDGANSLERSAQQLGVRSFITSKIEAWGSIGNGRINRFATAETNNFTGYQVGSNYWLSKRTNAYAIFGSNVTSTSSANASFGTNSYAVGVRHTF